MPQLKHEYPYYLANQPQIPNTDLEVIDTYSDEVVARVAMADESTIDCAIGAAVEAAPAMAAMRPFERKAVLEHCRDRFQERQDELAYALCVEAGKPLQHSRGEVARLIETFTIAAEESIRINGELINLEISARVRGYSGMVKRVPIGPVSLIAPFNFPLNLVAHKVAPAIAAGCPFILKPSSRTPIGALIIGEILAETDLPEGAFSILPCRRDGARLFTEDERLKLLSFTGSAEAGWELKSRAGKKKVALELGGNAAVAVDEDADLEDAAKRIAFGAYYQSGQSCISVQRILAHESIYNELKERLVEEVIKLKMGDPKDEDTFIGPVIDDKAAERIESWIDSATRNGANILCGGNREGRMIEATLLENVSHDEPAYAQEIFGPVALIEKFNSYDAALDEINNSRYGLQAGVFTRDIYKIQKAWDTLEVGGVTINEIPSWRVDHMPYGGVKDSGLHREGLRWSIEDMTEPRLLVIRDPGAQ